MFNIILFSVLLLIAIILIFITYQFRHVEIPEATDVEGSLKTEVKEARLLVSQGYIYALIVFAVVCMLLLLWQLLRGTPYEGHFMEWLNIVVRLMHITFGIAWIGASFYFVWLENALNRTSNVRDELAGNLWAVHGGGFYYLEKYKVSPQKIPKDLHWFKYEAYFTWLSGFCLLFVVYYFNAEAFLIDKNVRDLSPVAAVSIGVGSFVAAYFIYHCLCKTPLVKSNLWFILTGSLIACGFAFFYTQMFSARAAYIHFGAMLGTLMAANVFFIIIPAQKAMVNAARQGKPVDPAIGKFALMRSIHNNYFTLPVLFVMISNHFPSTFGFRYPWLSLMVISFGTAGIKHWLNLRERRQLSVWVLPVSVLVLLSAAYITAPKPLDTTCKSEIKIGEVNAIVEKRCKSCHSSHPTDDVFTAPPNGVVYETPQDIAKLKDKIMQRVVVTKTMPQNNKTGMTEEERQVIACWLQQGAAIK